MKTKHGILSLISGIFMLDVSDGTHINIDEAPDMLEKLDDLAIDHRLTHLWIHPSTLLNFYAIPPDVEQSFTLLPTWKYDTQIAKKMQNPLVSYYGKRLLRPYDPFTPQRKTWNKFIIFLQHVLWDWPKDATPLQILTIIANLEEKLGVQMSGSPSGVGWRYLKKIHANKPHWLEKPETNLNDLPWHEAAKPLIWSRVPSDQELHEARYLLAVDKNSAYPRAAQEERFGVGEPEHHQNMELDSSEMTDFKVPGIWHIQQYEMAAAPATTLVTQDFIPSPLARMHTEWVATPLLKALIKYGYHLTIDECWIFPKHEAIWKKWVEQLWTLRQSADVRWNDTLRSSIKQVMNDTLGLTRSQKFSESPMARPDWNAQVVAGSRANMLYNILKYAKEGYYPIMCQMDALYYLTKYPDPNMAIPGITAQSGSLGGYKLKWVLPLNSAVSNLLVSPMAQSKKLQQLNLMAAELEKEAAPAWI